MHPPCPKRHWKIRDEGERADWPRCHADQSIGWRTRPAVRPEDSERLRQPYRVARLPLPQQIMKFITPMSALLGLALLSGLIAYYGFPLVGRALASSGWGAALVIGARAIGLMGAGIGWGVLIDGMRFRRSGIFVGLRFIREAINCLFPVAQVGGDLIGARLLTFFGVAGGLALASVLVDIFVQVVSLVVFVLVGTAILPVIPEDRGLITRVLYGLALAVPAIVGFYLVLRLGVSQAIRAKLTAFTHRRKWIAISQIASLGDHLQGLWGRSGRLSASLVIHTSIWFFGALEVFVALRFMGHAGSLAQAIAIESIGQGIRAAAFAIPGGLGVQDGGLIAVGAVFGVPAEVALAVALLKRIAEIVLGVPSLLAWQALEGRRLLRKPR
jgi:putative membrane protein